MQSEIIREDHVSQRPQSTWPYNLLVHESLRNRVAAQSTQVGSFFFSAVTVRSNHVSNVSVRLSVRLSRAGISQITFFTIIE